MKKIILVFLALCFFVSSVQAEFICMRNSKKSKVVNGKVNIKLPQLLTVASGACPAGYTFLTDLDKAPVTQTGVWNLSGPDTVGYAACTISFPTALQSQPSEVRFVQAGVVDSVCTGSSLNPTAPEGTLCIYETYASGMEPAFEARYYIYNPAENDGTSVSTASVYGGAMYGYSAGATNFYAWGTWAVTYTPITIL